MPAGRLRPNCLKKVGVLYEDDDVVVVDKPAGIAVHGGADTKGRDLLTILLDAYDRPQTLHLAHRLDRGTSGVLMLAKEPSVAAALQGLWPSAEKRYVAIVLGRLTEARAIDTPLNTKDGRPQSARSEVTPLAVGETATLVQVDIITGRQHQIRRHLAGIEHPVAMDDKYGNFSGNKAWGRAVREAGAPRPKHVLLHACRLAVVHPSAGDRRTFEAPMPAAWQDWLPHQPK